MLLVFKNAFYLGIGTKKEFAGIEFLGGVKNIDDIYGVSVNDFML